MFRVVSPRSSALLPLHAPPPDPTTTPGFSPSKRRSSRSALWNSMARNKLAVLAAASLMTMTLLFVFMPLPSDISSPIPPYKSGLNPSFAPVDEQTREWQAFMAQQGQGHQSYLDADEMILHLGYVIYTGPNLSPDDVKKEENWALLDFQKRNGQLDQFLKQLESSFQLLRERPKALLVFSGGQTRAAAGSKTEAASCIMVAETMNWYGMDVEDARRRTITEEFARDSWENLVFSLCRFRELTGHYPRKITVVGLEFKRYRFENMHRPALRWPADAFEYIGVGERKAEVPEGERLNAIQHFQKDLYACRGALRRKKLERDPFKHWHGIYGYLHSCPEMSRLLQYCSDNGDIYPHNDLPWSYNLIQ